jgi:hypothetical protein
MLKYIYSIYRASVQAQHSRFCAISSWVSLSAGGSCYIAEAWTTQRTQLNCRVAQTTQKTSHVIAISPVHWRAECCLATSYKHSSYCCVRVSRGAYRAVAWQCVGMSQYCHVVRSGYRPGFGLDIGFIDHFNIQLVITFNYSAIADFHTLEFTRAYAKSSPARSVFTSSCLVEALTMDISLLPCSSRLRMAAPYKLSTPATDSFLQPPVHNRLCRPNCLLYNPFARTK